MGERSLPLPRMFFGLALCCALLAVSARATSSTVIPLSTPPLGIVDEDAPRGIFDPSLLTTNNAAYPFLMTYSGVSATNNISTGLAVFDESANAWGKVSAVNAALVNASLPCAGGSTCVGSLVHEVSSLFAVAGSASSPALLCVLAHSYIVTGATDLLHYDWGYISMYISADGPAGPWAEQKLLGWAGASSISTQGVALVLTDAFPALSDCLFFTEPGSTVDVDRGVLLLALGCISLSGGGGQATIRIVLLSAVLPSFDAWTYVGVLVDGATDAALLGFSIPQLNAADLFWSPPAPSLEEEEEGPLSLFLSISPSALIPPYNFTGYVGCLILQLSNGSEAGVLRNASSGAPLVLRSITTSAPSFSGACSVASSPSPVGSRAGMYVMPVLDIVARGGWEQQLPGAPSRLSLSSAAHRGDAAGAVFQILPSTQSAP